MAKLITKAIEKLLLKSPLYSKDGQDYDAEAILKFFLPAGCWTWYVTEAEKHEDDWLFFGMVVNGYGEKELGYFNLSELESVKINVLGYPLGIERDLYFKPTKLKDIKTNF